MDIRVGDRVEWSTVGGARRGTVLRRWEREDGYWLVEVDGSEGKCVLVSEESMWDILTGEAVR